MMSKKCILFVLLGLLISFAFVAATSPIIVDGHLDNKNGIPNLRDGMKDDNTYITNYSREFMEGTLDVGLTSRDGSMDTNNE